VRNRAAYLKPMLHYLGAVYRMFGFVLLVPLGMLAFDVLHGRAEVSPGAFLLPAVLTWALGLALTGRGRQTPLDGRRAMLVTALGWITISALGALPFTIGIGASYLDAFFESVSGFTTTGITMFTGLDDMPRSILLWRALTQWVGGLGILTFFLAVTFSGGGGHRLYSAESHKIASSRPAPGLFHTLRILWIIYAGITAAVALALVLQGVSIFDAVAHSFTALSTGGYSPYDASIDHYRAAGYAHYAGIEITLMIGMLLGGMNFLVHYRVFKGSLRALWDNTEVRLFWYIIAGATLLVAIDHFARFGFSEPGASVRTAAFQTVSIITTTGFATRDIGTAWFPALSKQIFLVLMVIGGCVGSTGGGIKVMRVAVLGAMLRRQVTRVVYGDSAVSPVVIDGEIVSVEELRRISALFYAWVLLLFVGAAITAFFSDLGPLESASGMFSALGNIGPCYIAPDAVTKLHGVVKLTYAVGMLAGRLEILPVLLLFTPRAWR
jgi:trk system potassium uptake protein TrkH